MLGFHLRVRCPKWTPAESRSFTLVCAIVLVYVLLIVAINLWVYLDAKLVPAVAVQATGFILKE
jgi:hypothetical protein